MTYFFDTGQDNSNVRSVFADETLSAKVTKYAESFKKAEKKIHDKYQKLVDDLVKEEAKEIKKLISNWKKRISIKIEPPAEE